MTCGTVGFLLVPGSSLMVARILFRSSVRVVFMAGFNGPFGGFLFPLFHGSPSAETDTALFVNPKALDGDFIADLDDVLDTLDPEIGQLTDVHQTFSSGMEFNKGTELLDGDDLGPIDFTRFGNGSRLGLVFRTTFPARAPLRTGGALTAWGAGRT